MTHAVVWLDRSPFFSHFYYHPCLNYSVAAISITPAILYLAPPYVDCINISLQIFHEHPWQEGREAAAQNQAQLVTKKNKKLDLKFFFFFPLSILKAQD